ncbi:hypothetical protein K2173_017888 [Erythroxylum novogranatense]|uniref:Phytocyanin domain-containing protein n=1 Tax=Erythroxylum novogranatense TaxID=1862640 RepID=A0AAV8SM14_9ROSI|nr:hypothetical protein K2173_017888 [Erythroxylum novogranatense]
MAKTSNMTVLVVAVTILGATTFLKTHAADHVVGDSTGWQTPSDSNFYSTWASRQTFAVGDTLTFNFATGVHSVATVSSNDYNNCNTAAANNVQNTGPATITLNSTGQYYYFCTFSNHCSRGQKLAVTVGGTSSSGPSSSPPGTTTFSPPPPPHNSASTTTVLSTFGMTLSMITAFLLS